MHNQPNSKKNLMVQARAWGVWPRYIDGFGRDVEVDHKVLAAVLESIAPCYSPADASPPRKSHVVRRGESRLGIAGKLGTSDWAIERDGALVATVASEADASRVLDNLPIGVCELRSLGAEGASRINLIVAPSQTYQGPLAPPLHTWLIAVQLYGIRSKRNWGHGDFGDLAMLLDFAASCGAGGIGLNPLHVLFDDRPEHISPYSPNSRNFIDPLYIDVQQVPDFTGAARLGLAEEIERLRACDRVDYPGVRAAKFKTLRACYAQFRARGAHNDDFDAFRVESGVALQRFACFEVIRRRFGKPWWLWPEEWRSPNFANLESLSAAESEGVIFQQYLQWIADRQLAACRRKAQQLRLPVGIYADLAVGVVPDGADAWCGQGSMLHGLSIGAPPDRFNPQGQSWGLTTFSPAGLADAGFAPFRDMLASAMRHAGAIRIDHVLGLNRLFLIPDGMSATAGTYVDFPMDALLAVIAEQSERHGCVVIGEDLGTVPEDFRSRLERWGLWTYRVMQFERDAQGRFHPPQSYPERALVTFATHDLPTFAGWWSGHDLKVRRDIGIDPGDTLAEREHARSALRDALAFDGPWRDGGLSAVARHLAATPSRIVCVSLEDIMGSSDQPNLPGTIDQYPNWRVRPPDLIENLAHNDRLGEIADVMRAAGRSTVRSVS